MDELLTTKQAASLFAKSEKTIGRYVEAFPKHFSDPAKQLDGSQRRFGTDDLRVLSLIHLMKAQGKTFVMIAKALDEGERAEPPQSNQFIIPKSYGRELALENRIQSLEKELTDARSRADRAEGQVELLERQLEKLQERLFRRDW